MSSQGGKYIWQDLIYSFGKNYTLQRFAETYETFGKTRYEITGPKGNMYSMEDARRHLSIFAIVLTPLDHPYEEFAEIVSILDGIEIFHPVPSSVDVSPKTTDFLEAVRNLQFFIVDDEIEKSSDRELIPRWTPCNATLRPWQLYLYCENHGVFVFDDYVSFLNSVRHCINMIYEYVKLSSSPQTEVRGRVIVDSATKQ